MCTVCALRIRNEFLNPYLLAWKRVASVESGDDDNQCPNNKARRNPFSYKYEINTYQINILKITNKNSSLLPFVSTSHTSAATFSAKTDLQLHRLDPNTAPWMTSANAQMKLTTINDRTATAGVVQRITGCCNAKDRNWQTKITTYIVNVWQYIVTMVHKQRYYSSSCAKPWLTAQQPLPTPTAIVRMRPTSTSWRVTDLEIVHSVHSIS